MRYLLPIFLLLIFSSCQENKKGFSENEIQALKNENDSLKKIISDINNKYVFDSISFREIENDCNTNKLNSTFKSKFYVIGYNTNNLTHFVKVDSNLDPIDTLKLEDGGYEYSLLLDEEENNYRAYIHYENEYGKKYMGYLVSTIRTEE